MSAARPPRAGASASPSPPDLPARGRADNRAGPTLTWPHGSVRVDARAVARRRAGRRARAPARGSLPDAAGARGRRARVPAVRAGDRDRAGSRARPVRSAGSARCGVRHLAARPEALRALARVAGIRRGGADHVAVALVGWKLAGLPVAAAIALGAIVAPPDAVAAGAVLRQFQPPRRIMAILQSESLLNDATALLIYRVAVVAATGSLVLSSAAPMLAVSAVGSVAGGYVLARLYLLATMRVRDPASATILQFVGAFGVWILAERIGLSAIITMVVYAMTLAR